MFGNNNSYVVPFLVDDTAGNFFAQFISGRRKSIPHVLLLRPLWGLSAPAADPGFAPGTQVRSIPAPGLARTGTLVLEADASTIPPPAVGTLRRSRLCSNRYAHGIERHGTPVVLLQPEPPHANHRLAPTHLVAVRDQPPRLPQARLAAVGALVDVDRGHGLLTWARSRLRPSSMPFT